ncbi:wsc domain protein [Niveomyces insectorum RCEF 264]|uniref:Wsc domain protein n=1 Tax=Niveomyces insectorum RCEF 264 TaxID=1081102 RepID=A0A162KAM9_9HYPO|nr:wsc domain protein [Niveomyces insectorum RCEF 264]
MRFTTILALTAGPAAHMVTAATAATPAKQGVEQPSSSPVYLQPVVQGCFSSPGDLVLNSTQPFNSRGKCGGEICQPMGKLVGASTLGTKCYCGDSYPPKESLVDDKFCNTPCTGFGQDACGGPGYFTVYNTGLQLSDIPYANTSSSSSAAPSSTTTSSSTSGPTVFVTPPAQTSAPKKSGGTNVGGIAAGVVVGVVVVAAGVLGFFFFLRRRRNREIEEEYRRNAAVNAFFGNGKPPSSSGGYSGSDARLDPVMSQRRLSDGSIADNEDYSRRILRVTNA